MGLVNHNTRPRDNSHNCYDSPTCQTQKDKSGVTVRFYSCRTCKTLLFSTTK